MSSRPKWMPSRESLLALAHNETLYADCGHAYAGEELEEVIREAALAAATPLRFCIEQLNTRIKEMEERLVQQAHDYRAQVVFWGDNADDRTKEIKALRVGVTDLIDALLNAAEIIGGEFCSHNGDCGQNVRGCKASFALAAIEKAEGRA